MGTMKGNGTDDERSGRVATGESSRTEGTNVVRVPFGVRRARRSRPERKPNWATLVLSFQAAGGGHPTPPHAA